MWLLSGRRGKGNSSFCGPHQGRGGREATQTFPFCCFLFSRWHILEQCFLHHINTHSLPRSLAQRKQLELYPCSRNTLVFEQLVSNSPGETTKSSPFCKTHVIYNSIYMHNSLQITSFFLIFPGGVITVQFRMRRKVSSFPFEKKTTSC